MILAVPFRKLDATGDGCTAITSTPCGCASAASDVANREMNALVAEYIAVKGEGIEAAAEEVKQTRPGRPLSYILSMKWCVIRTAETALQCTLARWRSMPVAWKKPVTMYPALLTRRETLPHCRDC